MMTHGKTSGNAKKVAQLEATWAGMLGESLQHGFFGTVAVELTIQDGTIQNIRRRIEQIEK